MTFRLPAYSVAFEIASRPEVALARMKAHFDAPPAHPLESRATSFSGVVGDGWYSCRPRLAYQFLRLNAEVSGMVTATPTGESRVTVRVLDWNLYLVLAPIVVLVAASTAGTRLREVWLPVSAGVTVFAAYIGFYVAESRRLASLVREIVNETAA